MLKEALEALVSGKPVESAGVGQAVEAIMAGGAEPAQVGAFLTALRLRGENAEVVAQAATVMRKHMLRVPHGLTGAVLDTCGTGGDGANTFNISTTAAFVASGAGAVVAKHGNRSNRSASGSSDVMSALGVNLDPGIEAVAEALQGMGLAFCFAPRFHPAMRHVAPIRAALGLRTLFNLLGPLANPAGATHQMIGVAEPAMVPVLAEALGRLGAKRALVFTSRDGLDELRPGVAADAVLWADGRAEKLVLEPLSWGLQEAPVALLRGGAPADNARITELILKGEAGPRAQVVLANAGAALWVAGLADSPREGVMLAERSLKEGAAWAKLEGLRQRCPLPSEAQP